MFDKVVQGDDASAAGSAQKVEEVSQPEPTVVNENTGIESEGDAGVPVAEENPISPTVKEREENTEPIVGAATGAVTGPPMVAKTNDSAIIALVLSAASWIVLPVIFALAGLYFAYKADKEIAATGESGAGMSLSAKILSWSHLVFIAFIVLIVIAILVFAAGVSINTPGPIFTPSPAPTGNVLG